MQYMRATELNLVISLLGSASQWTRSSGQATPSPNFDSGLQSMVSRHTFEFISVYAQRY